MRDHQHSGNIPPACFITLAERGQGFKRGCEKDSLAIVLGMGHKGTIRIKGEKETIKDRSCSISKGVVRVRKKEEEQE